MTYKQIVQEQSKFLREVTHIPQKEVEILILHLVQQNTIWLHLNYDKECTCEKELEKLVKKRATHYPLEYITSRATFYGEVFAVLDGVLIPRPETEILVEKAEEILKTIENPKILEIGVGSGVISIMLAILIKNIKIIAVDISDKALELAKSNAIKHGVENKITFINSNLFENITDSDFDMVVSNPPYIANNYNLPSNVKYEPLNALFGGNMGDELLKDIIIQTNKKDIKYLLCEMGYDQQNSLKRYVNEQVSSFKKIEFYKDYDKFDRGFTLIYK